MNQHTAGPWVVYPETDGTEICAVRMERGLPIVQCIARVVVGENWIANGAVLAAAPEVLEALRGLLAVEDSVTLGQERELRAEWVPKARAALAKASRS